MKTKQQTKNKEATKTKSSFSYPKNPVVHPGTDAPLLVLMGPLEVLEDPKWLEIVRNTYPDVDRVYKSISDEYAEKQFHDDLRKASRPLQDMAAKALKDHRAGRTRKFPA